MGSIEPVGTVVLQVGRFDEEGERVWICRVKGTRAIATDDSAIGAAKGAMKAAQDWLARGKLEDPYSICKR